MRLLIESFDNDLQCTLPPPPSGRALAAEAATDELPFVVLGAHLDQMTLFDFEPLHPTHSLQHLLDGLR